MRNIQIITDSCSDLSGALLEQYGIDYARMNTVYHEKETPASLTWEYYSPKELYDIMRGGERVTTTQVPTEEFNRIFTEYLGKNCDIIYIGCSSKQSGSVNTASVVSKKLLEQYPDAKIACIDSLNASIGEGMLAIRAAQMVQEGMSFDAVAEAVTALRNQVNQYVTVHSLEFLRKAGRVTASSAFFGNLMGVKPILISDANGVQTPIKKVKGRMTSLKELVALLKESIIDSEQQTVYLAHADCPQEELDTVCSMIKEQIPCSEIVTVTIGPIIGASIGPDAIGIWAFGKEVVYAVGEAK